MADKDDTRWSYAAGLDEMCSPGCYLLQLRHNCPGTTLPLPACDEEHYITATLIITEIGTDDQLQRNRLIGQTLIMPDCNDGRTRIFNRTLKKGNSNRTWNNWNNIAQSSMDDEITSTEDLIASVTELKSQTKEIKTDLSSETARTKEAEAAITEDAILSGSMNITPDTDRVTLSYRNIDGTEVSEVEIPAATTKSAGVMSAEDKIVLCELPARIKPLRYVVGDNSIADCFVYVEVKGPFQDITVQRFKGINDTEIVLCVWEDGIRKSFINLAYSAAEIDGSQYIWQTDDYVVIVDFALHKEADGVATLDNTGIYLSHKCFAILTDRQINALKDDLTELTRIPKMQGYYIDTEGNVIKTPADSFWLSSYAYVDAGVIIRNAKPAADASNSYIHFYDCNFNHLSYIASSGTTEIAEVIISEEDIPEGAKYMRAVVAATGDVFAKTLIDLNDIAPLPVLRGEIEELLKISKQQGYYINTEGNVIKTPADSFWLSSYAYADAGVIIRNAKPVADASNSYIHFYDSNFNHISYIASSGTTEIAEVIITEDDIPEGARYMRAVVAATGDVFAKTLIDLNDIAPKTLGVPFDYATALSMDKNVLRNAVEAASAGKCTVLYDSDGYPSLMYRIPVMSVGAFSQDLGDFTTPHPAFVVGGVRKTEIYLSVFQTCVYNGHYVSWFGLPSTASLGIMDLRQNIAAKGDGWHLETIYERSLLGLLALKYNSPTPRGNTCWGRSSAVGFEHECAKMYNGKLPGKASSGEGEQINGALWINGTQPNAWSHDKSAWGIQDVIGGYHEICDLIKMVDGFLYMAEDNNYSADESTWINTGVAIDARNGNNVFSTTVTSSMTESDNYLNRNIDKVQYDESFDTLSDAIRKRMAMLFITTRLTHDGKNLFGISGSLASRPAGVGYLVSGGATEYADSGLGYYNIAFDLSTVPAHNNMGSRMAYIG